MARSTGTVKRWNAEKGYGFVARDGAARGEKDIFVHFSAIEQSGSGKRNLCEGESVEFDIEQTDKGPQAVDVRQL